MGSHPGAVGSIRCNYPIDVHAGLVHSYGGDVTAWPGFPILRPSHDELTRDVAGVAPIGEIQKVMTPYNSQPTVLEF